MATPIEKLLEEALQLPQDQRAALAEQLLQTLPPPDDDDIFHDPEWLTEIERRVQGVLTGEPGIPWEEVKSRALKSLKSR